MRLIPRTRYWSHRRKGRQNATQDCSQEIVLFQVWWQFSPKLLFHISKIVTAYIQRQTLYGLSSCMEGRKTSLRHARGAEVVKAAKGLR
jgi:hypothetical protein